MWYVIIAPALMVTSNDDPFKILFYNIKPVASIQVSILSICYGNQDNDFDKLGQVEILLMVFLCFNFHIQVSETVNIA